MCTSDGVGELNFASLGNACGHDVLGDPARSVGCGTIDLRRVLARERAAAVAGHASVGVDDDLAAGEASVRRGAAQDETARGIDESLHGAGSQGETRLLDHRGDDVVAYRVGDRRLRERLVVLGGHDDRVDTHRATVLVRERHLSLAVRTQPLDGALLAHVG